MYAVVDRADDQHGWNARERPARIQGLRPADPDTAPGPWHVRADDELGSSSDGQRGTECSLRHGDTGPTLLRGHGVLWGRRGVGALAPYSVVYDALSARGPQQRQGQ